MLTEWVGQAWKELHERYKDTIIQTFRRVGLSLNPDGSEDHELKIKGLDDIQVGDYHSRVEAEPENGLGSLTAVDVTAVQDAQVKLAVRVAKSKAKAIAKRDVVTGQQDLEEESSSDDDDEHEEVFTLGRMNTRSQTRVNRYYTQEEVDLDTQLAKAQKVEEERLEGPRHYIDSSDGDGDDDDDREPEYDEDDDFDDGVQGDQDITDENME